jgi:hypothetical protein
MFAGQTSEPGFTVGELVSAVFNSENLLVVDGGGVHLPVENAPVPGTSHDHVTIAWIADFTRRR